MFIGGAPRNCATKMFAGRSYTSCGGPTCCSTPLSSTAARAHRHRLDLVVGDVDEGGFESLVEVDEVRRVSPRSLASRFDSGSSMAKTAGWRTIARASAHPLSLPS